MGRRQTDSEVGRYALLIPFLMDTISCCMFYLCFSRLTTTSLNSTSMTNEECCRGIQHLQLWGDVVKWGADHKFNSSRDFCMACKNMCGGEEYLCDSWMFCEDKEARHSRFGEKQRGALEPDRRFSADQVMWISGLVFGKRVGVVGPETDYGTIRFKLLPDCAPHSIFYILGQWEMRHCVGCQLHRAESRGRYWDLEGNHVKHASYGPPFAPVQGILEAHGTIFKDIPTEACPSIRRGSVAWVGSGPEFFISLANHHEWRKSYTVFGIVVPQDMEIVEKIAQLPNTPEVWSNVNVAVLEKPVPLRLRKMNTGPENMGSKTS